MIDCFWALPTAVRQRNFAERASGYASRRSLFSRLAPNQI